MDGWMAGWLDLWVDGGMLCQPALSLVSTYITYYLHTYIDYYLHEYLRLAAGRVAVRWLRGSLACSCWLARPSGPVPVAVPHPAALVCGSSPVSVRDQPVRAPSAKRALHGTHLSAQAWCASRPPPLILLLTLPTKPELILDCRWSGRAARRLP